MGFLLFAAEGPSEFVQASGWFLENAWLIPLLPALSFLGILFFGKRLPYKGAELGIAAVGIAFVLSVLAAGQWIGEVDGAGDSLTGDTSEEALEYASGDQPVAAPAAEGDKGGYGVGVLPVVKTFDAWWSNAGIDFSVGILVDGLAVMMLFVVTAISLLVHVYSTDYVAGDRRYTHFFAFLSLFTSAMLFFVLSENILQMIVGWELVGVCSFALIGHWWEDQNNSDAALKAFLTNRVGDIGLLVGMIILFWTAGSWSVLEINTLATEGSLSHTALLVASISLTFAVMSKSGQFILHTWLPDAMAGPTPVSALIHAATMVVAGIYMVARLYGVFFEGFSIAGSSINFLALVGAVTLVGAGLLAFVQNDIKKVLAYSTVSQLGYMVMALGVGAWTAAMFHLFTHAFFKAGLFLGSGSVSHSVHSFDMKKDMGGLRKYMPTTFWTFLICSVALMGLPPLAGFWSKDEILVGTGGWGFFGGSDANGDYTFALVMGLIGAALTCAYMTRTIYLTFFGEFRGHGHPHESGKRITVPLVILSVFAVGAGFLNFPPGFITGDLQGWHERLGHYVEPVADYFPAIAHARPSYSLAIVATLVALLGVAAAAFYFKKVHDQHPAATELADGPVARSRVARAGHTVLKNKYYLDHLYTGIIVGFVKGPFARGVNWFNQKILDGIIDTTGERSVWAGRWIYRNVDQRVIDGTVDGTGLASNGLGEELRHTQTGKVQHYAAILFAGTAILAGLFILFTS